MSKQARRVSSVVVIVVVMIVVMALGTCDLFKVGFGSKVDLKDPVATARNLTNGTYVRGVVTLSGDASDDVGVTAVSVQAVNASSGSTVMDWAPATLDAERDGWTIQIDTTGFPDGETTFNTKAMDAFGRSSVTTLFLYVDNTPPTIMITAPLMYGTSPAPQQSANIDIKGEVFDVSPVSEVRVRILKPDQTPLFAQDIKADGTNTWFANIPLKDTAGGPLTLAEDGTTYTYEVRAIDRAGNESSYYYHRMDISALVRSHVDASFPTMDEIGKLDQGIVSTGAVSQITAAELAGKRLAVGPTPVRGDFFFRYESLPDIKFTNLDRNATQNANVLAIGSPITGLITPPIGFGAVLTDSIEVRLYVGSLPDTSGIIRTIRDTNPLNSSDFISCDVIGDSVSFTIDLKNADGASDLDPGLYWAEVRAAADGTATAIQPVEFSIDSTAPILRETLMGSSTQNRRTTFRFGGNAASAMSLTGGTIVIEQAFNDPEAPKTVAQSITFTTDPDPLTTAWEWESVDLPAGSNGDGRYFYTITLTAPSGKTAILERSVIYDTLAPSISINRLDPLPDPVANKVNGMLTFYASPVDDNGIGEARWVIRPAAETPVWGDADVVTLAAPYSFPVDTSVGYAEGSSRLWVFARDRAGNQGYTNVIFDIDQSTDLPVINLTNMNAGGTAVENLQGVGAKVTGTLRDDDMLDASTLEIRVDGGAWTAFGGYSDNTAIAFQYTFGALTQGVHTFSLRVSDLASAKAGKLATQTELGPVSFAYDTAVPTLTIADAAGAWYNAAFVLNGTAQDSYGLNAVDISFDGGSSWTNLWSGSAVTGPQAWSYNLATHSTNLFDGSHEGNYTWQIRATDAFGQTAVSAFPFGVDTQINAPAITSPADGAFQVSSSVNVLGTASDPAGGSQIKEVYYAVASSEPARPASPGLTANWTANGWSVATGTTNWSAALTGLTEGTVTIWTRSVDVAGNMSAVPVSISFPMDLSSPTLTLTTPSASSTFSNAAFSLVGTTGDTNALASITITQNGSPLAGYNALSLSGTSYNINVTGLPSGGLVEGVYEYVILVTDAANKTTTLTRTVTVDTTSPELTLTSPILNEQIETSSYTIRGTVDGGYKAVTSLQWSLDNATWTAITPGVNWNSNITISTGGEGPKTLYLRADDGLNPLSTLSRAFYYDTAAPTLAETAVGSSLAYRTTDFSLSGTAGDSNALSFVRVERSADGGTSYNLLGNATLTLPTWTYAIIVDEAGHTTDGDFLYRITAVDAANRTTVLTRNVRIDTTNPTVSIIAPIATWYQGDSFTASGTAADAFPLSSVQYRLNGGGWVTANGTNSWFHSIDLDTDGAGADTGLPEGNNLFEARATDAAGNSSAIVSVTLINDQNPPTTTITVPSSASTQFAMSGTASDSNGLASIQVAESRDGGAATTVYATGLAGTSQAWTTGAGSLPQTGNLLTAGTYVYTITVTDAAGRLYSVNRTVYWDVEAPTVAVSQPGSGDSVFGANLVISGTASDIGAAGVALVEYRLDANGDGDYGDGGLENWTAASGTTSWTATVDLDTDGPGADTGMGEGAKTLQVRATDNAGNQMATPVTRSFIVDQAAPTLTETVINTVNAYRNAAFSFGGNGTDTNALANLSVFQSFNGGALVQVSNQALTGTSQAWTLAGLPRDPATPANTLVQTGEFAYTIYLTDAAGKTVQLTRTVTIDNTPPVISFTDPIPSIYDGSLYGTGGYRVNGTISFRGTVTDNMAMATLQTQVGTQAPQTETNKYSFVRSIDTTAYATYGHTDNGDLVVTVTATDMAGNTATVGITYTMRVDQSSDRPTLELTNLNPDYDTPGEASGNLLEYTATAIATATDDDSVAASSVQISIDGGAYAAVSTPPGANGSQVTFRHDLTSLSEGQHYFTIRLADVNFIAAHPTYASTADWTTFSDPNRWRAVGPVYFVIDRAPPSISVTGPVNGSPQNADFNIVGTASDTSGLRDLGGTAAPDIEISTDGGATYARVDTAGADIYSRTFSIPIDVDVLTEGSYTWTLRATDVYGKTSVTQVQYVVDKTGPTMAINTPNVGQTVNGTVNLSGTGAETYGFISVQVALDSNADGDFVDANDMDWTAATGTYSWSYSLNTALRADGTYTLYVRGLDDAGNYSTGPRIATRSFIVDQASDRPVITLSTLTLGGTAHDNLLPGSLQMSGTASDDDSVSRTSIQIRIDANNDGDFGDGGLENWANITGQPALDANVVTWSHTFSGLSDGAYRFEIRAGDVEFGGNYGSATKAVTIGPVLFSIDTALPTGTVTGPAQGAFTRGSTGAVGGTVDITGTASDASGIASVQISVNGAPAVPVTGTTNWSYTYTVTGDGQVTYQIIITDNYGKIFTIDRYFTVDITAPVPAYLQPASAAHVNGAMTVRGTTSEANQVSDVYLYIGPDGGATPGNPAVGNWTGWTHLAGTFNWSYVVDTTLPATPDGTYDIHVRAVDSAGNLSADVVQENVVYDQTANLPVITFTNLNPTPANNIFGAGGVIQGTVSDDDGVNASTIQISFDGGSTWANVSNQGSNGVNVSWSHNLDLQLESGPTANQVRVRAYDVGESVGGVTIPPVATTTAIYNVAIDRGNPVLANTSFTYLNRYDATPQTVPSGSMSGARIHNNFRYNFTASDGAGLSSVQVSRNGGAYAAATNGGGNNWYYDVGIDVAGHSNDGTLTLAVQATDTWGRTGTSTIALTIDTTEPVLSNILPAADAFVNGMVAISGTTFDVGTITSGTVVGGLTNVPLGTGLTGSSWSTNFNAYDYDEATYATYQAGTQTWLFPITITMYDNAANRTILTRNLYLDPNGDRPVIAGLQPADGAQLAGTIVLSSAVTDDDAPAYVRIWADLNDDGDYADDFPLDLNADTDTTDPFENEANYLQVAVTNNSWNTLVNGSNEFSLANMVARGVPSPTGWMRLHFIAYDNNATPIASLPSVRRIYIDETAPTITGLNYASGALVRGSISLTGTIEDDMAITPNSNMQISFNGGSSFSTLAGLVDNGVIAGKHNYSFTQPVDTSTYFPASSGILYVVLKVTDGTFKQSQVNLNFNVDNQYPIGIYDSIPQSLPQVGGRYNFVGNASIPGSNYQVLGYARDPGAVSAVADVRVYFVKNISGTNYFISPRSGGTLAVTGYSQTVRGTDIDLNNDGDCTDPGESAGMNASIPVPPETLDGSHLLYYIQVDNRLELNQFDAVVGIGDQDGFNESLKSQSGGYDEWSAFFDTTILPDGQVTVYYLVTDTAGNRVYQAVNAQVANHPPVIGSVDIDAGGTDYTGLFKRAGTLFLRVNATDIEGIDATSYTATVIRRRVAPNGADDPTGSPAVNTVIQDDANNGEFTIDVSGWEDGVQYTLRMQVADTDGNIDAFDLDVWVNNNDATPPRVAIDDFRQVHVDPATGHIDEAGFSLNDGTSASGAITAVTSNTNVTAASLAGNAALRVGSVAWFSTGEWRTLTAVNVGTGAMTLSSALSTYPTVGSTVTLYPGDGGALSSVAGDRKSATVASFVGNANIAVGWTVTFADGQWRTINAFTPATGTIAWEEALSSAPTIGTFVSCRPGQADLSGLVTITGTAWDDTEVTSVGLRFLGAAGTWSTVGVALTPQGGDIISGYSYTWSYTLDTTARDWDSVTGGTQVTGLDKLIEARSFDGSNYGYNGADGLAASRTVDVVPYITSVDTVLSAADTTASVYNRSSLGYYPVRSDESITLHGFNFQNGSTILTHNGAPLTATVSASQISATMANVGVTIAANAVTLANHSMVANQRVVFTATAMPTGLTADTDYYVVGSTITGNTFRVSATPGGAALAISGGTAVVLRPIAGDLLVKVNGVSTTNNGNDNSRSWNGEANGINNNLLNDDRRLSVWGMTTMTGIGEVRNLDMEVNGNTLNFGAGYTDTNYSLLTGVTGTTATINTLRQAYTRYFDNKIAYNTNGTVFSVSQCADTYLVPVNNWNYPSNFAITRGTPGTLWEYNNSNTTGTLFLESNWNGADINKLDRVQWPDLKVRGNDALSYIYISYYDSLQKLIKFRYGEIGTAGFTAGLTTTANLNGGYSSTFRPYLSANGGNGTYNTTDQDGTVTQYTGGYNQGYVVIAGANANSAHSAVGFTSTGVALVSWWDSVNGDLKLKYNTAPATSYSGFQAFTSQSTAVPAAGTYTFKLTVNGVAQNGGNDISVTVPTVTNGDRKHRAAYELNLVLSNGYGAFAEVDPVTSRVTVRSMQTGAASSILISAPTAGSSLITAMGGVQAAVAGTGQAWVETTIDANAAGKNVSMAVDGNNGIHIAYQNTGTNDLRYAYLSAYNAAPVLMTVDSYLQVGTYGDITTRVEDVNGDGDTEIVPYISYYQGANVDTAYAVRFARFKVDAINTVADTTSVTMSSALGGASSDRYTGNWEIMTVPAIQVPKQYRISSGVTTAGGVFVAYQVDSTNPIEYARLW